MSRTLKLGLEVHAQLRARHKLFSGTRPGILHEQPNTHVSFFDAALPGTQPRLSLDCLNLAIKAGLALNADISQQFSFDRKHYMYPDQPSGYQITQHSEPIAKGGYLELNPRDYPQHLQKAAKLQKIRLEQIQLEQDTGKTTYVGGTSRVDLNRANCALIELVTAPDFTTSESAVVFIRKLQRLLRHIDVCSGEMETGAMRVDVNVSVDGLTQRCEIKNLFSPSAVYGAIKAEFARQIDCLDKGIPVLQESRGWDGKNTWRLRGKESALDYRYMPDPDLPEFILQSKTIEDVRNSLPLLPDTLLDKLLDKTYAISLVDAKTLLEHDGYVDFYFKAFEKFTTGGGSNRKSIATWLVHRWIGDAAEASSTKTESGDVVPLPPLEIFVDILLAIDSKRISTTTGKYLLKHVASAPAEKWSIDDMIEKYDLQQQSPGGSTTEVSSLCKNVVEANPEVVERIKRGKVGSISFLLGQVMKETQGTYSPHDIRKELEKLIH